MTTSVRLSNILSLSKGGTANYKEYGKYLAYGAGKNPTGKTDEYNAENNLIIGVKGTIGSLKIIRSKVYVISTAAIVRFDDEIINREYLYNVLCNINFKHYEKPTRIPELDIERFLKHQITLPSIKAQQDINLELKMWQDLIEPETIRQANAMQEYYKREIFNKLGARK